MIIESYVYIVFFVGIFQFLGVGQIEFKQNVLVLLIYEVSEEILGCQGCYVLRIILESRVIQREDINISL